MTDNATRMVRAALGVGVAIGLPAIIMAFWLRGGQGGWTAVGSVLFVAGSFALTGLGLRWAAQRSAATVQAVMLGGMLARLWFYAILLVTLPPTGLVDTPTLAVVVPLMTFVLLAVEVRLVTRPDFRMIHPVPWVPDAKDHP